jgi:hypothetical protein
VSDGVGLEASLVCNINFMKRPDLLKAIEILRVTLSSALSFEKLEVLIEYLKTLLEPQAGGHAPGPRTG